MFILFGIEFEFSKNNRNLDNRWESINMRIMCADDEGITHIEYMFFIVIVKFHQEIAGKFVL